MTLLQEWLDALCKANDVAIIAGEHSFIALVINLHHIDGSDGVGLRAYAVEIADYFLLVRNGYVETLQLGIGVEYLS